MGNVKLLKDWSFYKKDKVIYVTQKIEKELIKEDTAIAWEGFSPSVKEVKAIMDNDGKVASPRKSNKEK